MTQEPVTLPRLSYGAKKIFQVAISYGVVYPGFSLIDYLRYAIDNYGWECIAIGGVKGTAKSNLLHQCAYAIYQDWDTVDEHIVTEPEDFLRLIKIPGRHPFVGWDDISVHLPRSLYFTDRELWAELQKNWAAYRTKINCFLCTAPRKDRIASFVLEDLTGDLICFNRISDIKSHYDFQRWLWQRDLHDPTRMNATAVHVEKVPFPLTPGAIEIDKEMKDGKFVVGGIYYKGKEFYEKVSLLGMPRPRFQQYWDRRLELADKAGLRFEELLERRQPKPLPSEEKLSEASRAMLKARKAKRGY
jgi:hypothetical protein